MDSILEKFKNMTPEDAQKYLDAFEAEGGCSGNCAQCQSECNSRVKKPAKVVFAVLSGRGGTGNSTITAMLATSFAKVGLKVGIIDADISSAYIPYMYGIKTPMNGDENSYIPCKSKSGISIVSLAIDGKNQMDPIIYPQEDKNKQAIKFLVTSKWPDDLDVLLVDLPEAADDVTLEYYTTMPMDAMVVVSIPGAFNTVMTQRVFNLGKLLMVPVLGVIENFSLYDGDGVAEHTKRYGDDVRLITSIPYDKSIQELANKGEIEKIQNTELDYFAKALSEELLSEKETKK